MQSLVDFLNCVLPDTGIYCSFGISTTKRVKTKFLDSKDQFAQVSKTQAAAGTDAYFAVATFKDSSRRITENVDLIQSVFVDLDCGPDKPYVDQREALVDLRRFVKEVGLPRPTIVNSGMGIHAYWSFTEPLEYTPWLRASSALLALCDEHELHVDRGVTIDAARILRLPETYNFKYGEPLAVEVLYLADRFAFEDVAELLTKPAPAGTGILEGLDADRLAAVQSRDVPDIMPVAENFKSSFKLIMKRSIEGTGCAQMLHAYENQESLEEPLWRAMLSIANVCEDREPAIRFMSDKHPEYNEADALAKASRTKGPYTCDTFRKLRPDICEGCPHNITSPVLLGRVLKESEGPVEVADTKTSMHYVVPEFPKPYARGASGGVYKQVKDDDGNTVSLLVYPYDLYVVQRIRDPEDGETLVVRLHLPKDGVCEFLVPLSVVLSNDKLRDRLASQGVTAYGKSLGELMAYFTKWVEALQHKESASVARTQFGWVGDLESFVVGEREILPDEVIYSPPSTVTFPLVNSYGSAGSLEKWSEVVSYYAGKDRADRAFALFLGFGNLLLGMTNIQGYWLSLYSPSSGSGKTTVLKAIASIYGDPKRLLMREKDTENAFWSRTGVHNNIPMMLDEITNMSSDQMSRRVYGITEGRAKGRLMAHVNAERKNLTHWHTGVISSSNTAVLEKLAAMKSLPEGELMRMLEYMLEHDSDMSPRRADAFFGQLDDNFGLAVVPFVQYVMKNRTTIKAKLDARYLELSQRIGITGAERYWITMGALALVGGDIANHIGLVSIPVSPVSEFFVRLVRMNRRKVLGIRKEVEDFVQSYIQRHTRDLLVVRNKTENAVITTAALREPIGAMLMRYELDTHRLYISAREFRAECRDAGISFDDAVVKYEATGVYLGLRRVHISKGSVFDTGTRVSALAFDTAMLENFDVHVGIPNPSS